MANLPSEIQSTLERLARNFVVADIMIPLASLDCAPDIESARRKLDENPHYDVIPLIQGDKVVAFLERDADRAETIQIQHVVSEATSVLDLVDSLQDPPYLFVLSRQSIAGFVHFSDLNDPVVKLPFFVLLEALERMASDMIRDLVTDDSISSVVHDPKRQVLLREKMGDLRKKGADRDYVTLLSFREVLEAAKQFGRLDVGGGHIDVLSKVRTLVCHAATELLVEAHEDVRRLSQARLLSTKLLLKGDPL